MNTTNYTCRIGDKRLEIDVFMEDNYVRATMILYGKRDEWDLDGALDYELERHEIIIPGQ